MKSQHDVRWSFNAWFERSSLARAGMALSALLMLAACSGEDVGFEGAADEIVETESHSDALFAYNQPQVFKYFGAIPALSNDVGDGAMCTPANVGHSKIIFTRDTSNYIQGISDVVGAMGPWGKYGGAAAARQFGGRPACGFLSGSSSPVPFVLLAKGSTAPNGTSDRRLYWSRGNWTTSASAPPPASATQWAAISNTQFNTNGNPAVGTRNGQLVVTYLGDNGQLLGNYWIPASNTFSATVAGPTLPAGWTGVGTPAIHYAGSWSGRFTVVVRAVNSSNVSRFYITFFGANSFEGAVPGSGAAYTQVVLPANAPAIQSDPAYEFDDDPEMNSATLYYRNGSTIYQVTAPGNVYGFEQSTIAPITLLGGTPNITGNPLAIGGVPYEAGKHWLLMRGGPQGSELYFAESFNDGQHLIPDRAACANFATPKQIFGDGRMVGCSGKVTWANRGTLCASGSWVCSASQWHYYQNNWGGAPTYNYWTNDNLRWSGTGSNACSVSTTVGSQCASGQPMRVCTPSGTDPEGNACTWSNCGYGSNTPNYYFGGCSGSSNTTAGTLCCK